MPHPPVPQARRTCLIVATGTRPVKNTKPLVARKAHPDIAVAATVRS